MASHFTVATVQATSMFLDLDAGVDNGIALIEESASNGAKITAFPETWLLDYPWWILAGMLISRGTCDYGTRSMSYQRDHMFLNI